MPKALYSAVIFLLEQVVRNSEPAVSNKALVHSGQLKDEIAYFTNSLPLDPAPSLLGELKSEIEALQQPVDAVGKVFVGQNSNPLDPQAPTAE